MPKVLAKENVTQAEVDAAEKLNHKKERFIKNGADTNKNRIRKQVELKIR